MFFGVIAEDDEWRYRHAEIVEECGLQAATFIVGEIVIRNYDMIDSYDALMVHHDMENISGLKLVQYLSNPLKDWQKPVFLIARQFNQAELRLIQKFQGFCDWLHCVHNVKSDNTIRRLIKILIEQSNTSTQGLD